jgi:hypothetical protein
MYFGLYKHIIMCKKDDVLVGRIVKGIKWGGLGLFFTGNVLLFYYYSQVYQDGQLRG